MGALLAADPSVGTWKMIPARSSGTIPRDETVIVQQHGRDLTVEVMVAGAGERGTTLSIKYTVPTKGGAGRIQTGPYDGVSLKRINSREIEITYLTNGKETRSTLVVVSRDGRTMTSTGAALGEHTTWTMVFEKQRNRPAEDDRP